jgi:hypothetical protein
MATSRVLSSQYPMWLCPDSDCSKSLHVSTKHFKKHMLKTHGMKIVINAFKPLEGFERKAVLRHPIHYSGHWRCPYCAKHTHLLLEMDRHIRRWHAFPEPTYTVPPPVIVKEEVVELTEQDIKREIKTAPVSP